MRILTIEDDRRVARFVEKGLQAEGYQTEVVPDGQRGIEMAVREGYDLLLLDLSLPGLSGFEVCQRLREHGTQIPILILTGRDSVADKVKGFEVGADDYVTKPFAFEELLLRIKALLRRGKTPQRAPVRQVADLVLDHEAHEVRRAGQLIGLTPTEFTLLEYLMQSTERVLSRAMIEQRVWGDQVDLSTNVAEVYIRRLRSKVDHGHETRLIHTVRGIGYRLKEH